MKKINRLIFIFYVSISFNSSTFAQDIKNLIPQSLEETGKALSFPFKMENNDLYVVGGIIGTGLALYSYDGQIRHEIGKSRSSLNDNFFKIAKKFGDGGYDILFLTGWSLAGTFTKNEYMKETAFLAAKSFLSANSIGSIIKYSIGRARPYTGDGKSHFTPFKFKTSRSSFPSGHTVSAFSVATVFAKRSDYTSIKILSYSMACATALERVYSDKHWATDVFFGAALGYFIAKDIVEEKPKKSDFSIYPINSGFILALKI